MQILKASKSIKLTHTDSPSTSRVPPSISGNKNSNSVQLSTKAAPKVDLSSSIVIAGLGNPGTNYERTRHNIGFTCLDDLAEKHSLTWGRWTRGPDARVAKGTIHGRSVYLVKPYNFMNLSGGPTQSVLHYYKIPKSNLIVIHDELALPLGKLKFRRGGGSGGHNGITNIIQQLGEEFLRLRFGIDAPSPGADRANYVLGSFQRSEQPTLSEGRERCVAAIEALLKHGEDYAMNHFNKDATAAKKAPPLQAPSAPTTPSQTESITPTGHADQRR